jgi:hypothetical protein
MAATTGQGRSFTTFIAGLTGLCAGIAYFSTGLGKFIAVAGALVVVMSLLAFLKIKPLEGKPAQRAGAGGMKLIGAFISAFGWFLILVGLHVVTGTGGRIVLGLVGIGVTLFGIIYVLPAAFNKNAIWKS